MDENKAIILIVAIVALVAVIVMISGSGQQAAGNEVTGNVPLKIFKSKSYTGSSMVGMAYRSQAKKTSPLNRFADITGSEINSLQRVSVFRNIAGRSIIQTEITDNKLTLIDVIQVDTAAFTQRGVVASIRSTEAEFINTVNPDGTKNYFIILNFIKNGVRYTYVVYVNK